MTTDNNHNDSTTTANSEFLPEIISLISTINIDITDDNIIMYEKTKPAIIA